MGARRGEVGVAAERLKAVLTSKLELRPSTQDLNTGLFQAISLVNGFLFSHNEDVQAFQALKENVRNAILTKGAPLQSSKALSPTAAKNNSSSNHSQPRSQSALGCSRAFDGPNSGTLLFKPNRAQTTLPGMRATHICPGQQQTQQAQTQAHGLPSKFQQRHLARHRHRRQRHRALETHRWLPDQSSNPKSSPAEVEESLTPAQIEAELNRMYAYGSKKPSVAMDWTMPPSLMYTKAYAMNVNNDMGEMIKMQDVLANKAEALRQEKRKKKQQERLQHCDEQMAHVMARRKEEAIKKREMGLYMDNLIAESKRKDSQEKKEKEERQAALNALFTTQLREKAAQQETENMQLKRETALERMQNVERERQDRENRERQAALNREKNESMKRQLDEALQRQAQERAQQIEDERKATVAYMQEMDRQEHARQMVYKGRQDKLQALFERAGGTALIASMEEKARKDEADMLRAQALFEAQDQEKDRLRKMARNDMDRERRAVITQQLAEKEAALQAQASEARKLKEKLDAERAADKEASRAAKAALCEQQAKEREALKQAAIQENMRRYYQHNDPMSEREKGVHKKVLNMEERGFASLTLPKYNPMSLLKGS